MCCVVFACPLFTFGCSSAAVTISKRWKELKSYLHVSLIAWFLLRYQYQPPSSYHLHQLPQLSPSEDSTPIIPNSEQSRSAYVGAGIRRNVCLLQHITSFDNYFITRMSGGSCAGFQGLSGLYNTCLCCIVGDSNYGFKFMILLSEVPFHVSLTMLGSSCWMLPYSHYSFSPCDVLRR